MISAAATTQIRLPVSRAANTIGSSSIWPRRVVSQMRLIQ